MNDVIQDTKFERAYEKYSKMYTVAYSNIEGNLYLYRLLTMNEYNTIVNSEYDDVERENFVCNTVVLYPEKFDADEELAFIVTRLCQDIVDNSCVSYKNKLGLLVYFSDEITLLESQMACIIMKAFPSYKLEDIDNMIVPEFLRLYTYAEWMLESMEGFSIKETLNPIQSLQDAINANNEELTDEEREMLNPEDKTIAENNESSEIIGRSLEEVMGDLSKKNYRKEMTEEQKQRLFEFSKMHPEMNMEMDAYFTGAQTMTADTTPVPDRLINGSKK